MITQLTIQLQQIIYLFIIIERTIAKRIKNIPIPIPIIAPYD